MMRKDSPLAKSKDNGVIKEPSIFYQLFFGTVNK
ncbi:Uncharacterised protein [Streptococcus dysgalactiae subsp. equisimilis]|nr:Uncharacterised protein [Streptococcus dysgalactiae subsp. equisimilis]